MVFENIEIGMVAEVTDLSKFDIDHLDAQQLFLKAEMQTIMDRLCYPQLVGTIQLSSWRRYVKKYIWSF